MQYVAGTLWVFKARLSDADLFGFGRAPAAPSKAHGCVEQSRVPVKNPLEEGQWTYLPRQGQAIRLKVHTQITPTGLQAPSKKVFGGCGESKYLLRRYLEPPPKKNPSQKPKGATPPWVSYLETCRKPGRPTNGRNHGD